MSKKAETMEADENASDAQAGDSGDVIDNRQADTGVEQAREEDYEPAEFGDLDSESDTSPRSGDANLDVILDIPVTLSMEIGRTRVSIQELLQLAKGSVVELDRMAGEPLDVLVNGTLVARGEVVVVNDKFGVRLNDVISPADRVHTLR
jgi:flagellar motor switch protein FliN/FliY